MQHRHHHHHHHVMLLLFIIIINLMIHRGRVNGTVKIGIGVVLDMESRVGKTSKICIEMALKDFYQTHINYKTQIIPHFRDSKNDRVEAAFAVIQLLKDLKVMAIIGPQKSSHTNFVVDIGNKAKVPILSLATIPSLSPKQNPYLIRISHTTSHQAQPIAALINSFVWRDVVFVYQQGHFGSGFIPSLSEALLNVNVHISQRIVISRFASDDAISDNLLYLKNNQTTRVFVVHMLPDLGSRFFKKVNEARMMQEGYAWIITDVFTSLLHTLDDDDIASMQGVVGVKPNIPKTIALDNFNKKWKSKRDDSMEQVADMFGLWSYDATHVLSEALERSVVGTGSTAIGFQHPQNINNNPVITDLDAIGTSNLGSRLLSEIKKTRLKGGLSGDFFFVDGQLPSPDYQIVNINGKEVKTIGLWSRRRYKNSSLIVWPGGSSNTPQGWEIPATKENPLKVGFPEKGGFPEFINSTIDPETNETKPSGFCVDVFEHVMKTLPHAPPYKYTMYDNKHGEASPSYDDLVYQIVRKEYDVVIGDVTIRSNRSRYVEFTLPYTESGVSMVVKMKGGEKKNPWIFMRPLEKNLWLTTCGLFIYTGFVVWILEHQVNKEFRGRPYKQVGMIFWFSFSTLVFAHKEKMISNLARYVVIVWIFVVLVLQSSYIASLTSMLTVEQLEPDFTDIYDLLKHGDKVGYKDGSFVHGMLKNMGFEDGELMNYSSFEEYDDALSNGKVSAIFDELPYLKLFLHKHCNKYIMVGPTYKSAGFGFAFPKGSPLVPLVSKALLQITEEKLEEISKKWLQKKANCNEENGTSGVTSAASGGRLSLDSFTGLFIIAGVSSTSALIIYLFIFLYENKHILLSQETSITQKLSAIAKTFNQQKQHQSSDNTIITATTQHNHDDDDFLVTEDDITNTTPTPENHQAEAEHPGVLPDDGDYDDGDHDDDDNDDDDDAATPVRDQIHLQSAYQR